METLNNPRMESTTVNGLEVVKLQTLNLTVDSIGVATILLDAPGKSVNTLTPLMLAELGDMLSRIEQHQPKGVIFASAKTKSFIAGADLNEIKNMTPIEAEKYLELGQSLYLRIENLPCPTVAAINGDCLGGGMELALACNARVAADESSISIGLPEVKLGILPGWGGTVRLPRLIGLVDALPLLLAGKTLPPNRAKRAGIVDDVVRPEALLSAAPSASSSTADPSQGVRDAPRGGGVQLHPRPDFSDRPAQNARANLRQLSRADSAY